MMKRYAIFLIIALALHGILLLPFVHWFDDEGAAIGGGAGASIHISIEAPSKPIASEGSRATPLKPTATSRSGADKSAKMKAGQGMGASAGPADGIGSGTTGQNEVLAQIRQQIEEAKHYPLLARRRGVEGTAAVSFKINADGSVSGLKLRQSSGTSLLDQAALQTITRAAPFPAYPDPIQIGIRFAMHEQSD